MVSTVSFVSTLPSSQRAIVQNASGKAKLAEDVLVLTLLPGTILVKTIAVAIQLCDYKMGRMCPSENAVVGTDFSGTIVRIHADTKTSLQLGDLVCGLVHGSNTIDGQNGAFAEYIRAPADLVLRVPPGLLPEQAATLGTALATNCLALWDTLRLTASPYSIALKPFPVLVYGGSTTVGTMAIQLLRLSGLEPITTCSPHNTDLVLSYGATAVLDYSASSTILAIRELTGGRLGYVLDCIVDPESVACCYTAIGRVGGRYAGLEKFPDEARARVAQRRAVKAEFVMRLEVFGKKVELPGEYGRRASEEQHQVVVSYFRMFQRLLNDGKLKPHPLQVIPGAFGAILDGIQLLQRGVISGKKLVVLV
ncbi:hypothetical protein sscle_02g019300 [Sclerotinia sclerotiorum 1980 UF-70]|uniref:Enoyl reductase (ER) domain-containing protein n=1 Tax=Sclerotinia sclerotiorum (strain ATCC 18683 / 1980 / Ss-1) TaxID=665079 RepID=A0A1D9PWU6_SCLS1|nr:hypothetical protein sscle_02g019300 [Sclerotinia sclerotiorum 1980 UF-70]